MPPKNSSDVAQDQALLAAAYATRLEEALYPRPGGALDASAARALAVRLAQIVGQPPEPPGDAPPLSEEQQMVAYEYALRLKAQLQAAAKARRVAAGKDLAFDVRGLLRQFGVTAAKGKAAKDA